MRSRVVIVGAGFVGLSAARRIARGAPNANVTLINASSHFLFTPRLIDALAGNRDPRFHTADLRMIAKRDHFVFHHGTVNMVDRKARNVRVSSSAGKEEVLPYDWLILAVGADTATYGIPGVQEHAFPLKTYGHVNAIHERVLELLKPSVKRASARRAPTLSFAVVGAGATGVEALFALRQYAREAARECGVEPDALTFSILQAAPQILPGFPPTIIHGTHRVFAQCGVSVYIGDPVARIASDAIITASGRRVPSALTIWCAGIKPHAVAARPPLGTDAAGWLHVDRALRADERIFAAGDAVAYHERNLVIPKNAQTAMRMAFTLSENVLRAMRGRPPVAFAYRSLGNLITLYETGFVDLRLFCVKSRHAPLFRDWFYRWRFRQVTGN